MLGVGKINRDYSPVLGSVSSHAAAILRALVFIYGAARCCTAREPRGPSAVPIPAALGSAMSLPRLNSKARTEQMAAGNIVLLPVLLRPALASLQPFCASFHLQAV